jgi:hypothetical protein
MGWPAPGRNSEARTVFRFTVEGEGASSIDASVSMVGGPLRRKVERAVFLPPPVKLTHRRVLSGVAIMSPPSLKFRAARPKFEFDHLSWAVRCVRHLPPEFSGPNHPVIGSGIPVPTAAIVLPGVIAKLFELAGNIRIRKAAALRFIHRGNRGSPVIGERRFRFSPLPSLLEFPFFAFVTL